MRAMRVGQGFDTHAFAGEADNRPLVLGGVTIPQGRGLAGHSDADVLVHAIIDALLGAAGLGDIGAMFPSSDARWSNASSIEMLRLAALRVSTVGYKLVNLDATIIAEAPKLAPHITTMRETVGGALGAGIDQMTQINVKATTSDGLGFTGRGEGIAAFAIVLLE